MFLINIFFKDNILFLRKKITKHFQKHLNTITHKHLVRKLQKALVLSGVEVKNKFQINSNSQKKQNKTFWILDNCNVLSLSKCNLKFVMRHKLTKINSCLIVS
ncbi:MAG: hypothetical protein A2033_06705 [Bacteroidetes bacterium GWA2_31_9]|nr:MAG: hypothetical protein A2033_06705 [Bacteroidetes bacterium GWA2_31_9]